MKDYDKILLQEAYSSIYEDVMTSNDALMKLPDDIRDIAISLKDYLSKGARKASFYYRSKDSGREGKYYVDLGVDYGEAKRKSHQLIKDYMEMLKETDPQNSDIEVAEKILNPPPRKSSTDRKIHLGHGISIQDTLKEPNVYKLYIYAYMQNEIEKDEEGKAVRDFENKFVRDAKGKVDEVVPPTKEKKFSPAQSLHYKLKTPLSRFRQFILNPENISGVTAKGGVIEFQNN